MFASTNSLTKLVAANNWLLYQHRLWPQLLRGSLYIISTNSLLKLVAANNWLLHQSCIPRLWHQVFAANNSMIFVHIYIYHKYHIECLGMYIYMYYM